MANITDKIKKFILNKFFYNVILVPLKDDF